MRNNELKILIVDDEELSAEYYSTLLRSQGYRTLTVNHFSAAITAFKEFQPDLVLIDLYIGQDSGIDLLDLFLSLNPAVGCIMFSGNEDLDSVLMSLRHGAVDFIKKGIPEDELYISIERASEKIFLNQKIIQSDEKLKKTLESLNKANIDLYSMIQEREIELENKNIYSEILFDNAADGIFIHDAYGVIKNINQAVLKTLEYSEDEIKELTIFDIEVGASREELLHLWDVCEPGKPVTVEGIQRRKGGSEFPVDVKITAFLQKDKKYLLAIARDITKRKQSEKDLMEAKLLAEFANKAKSEFLARMSHELRTPLNAILGFGQLMKHNPENMTEVQIENMDFIMESGEHLLMLINEVLDIAKVDAGEMSLSIESISLKDALESSIMLVNPLAKKNEISLINEIENFPYCVKADMQRLKQVLVNLLSNAVKYNKKKGHVKIHGDISEQNNPFPVIKISISDSGFGIREKDFPKIFEPFQRVYMPGESIEGSGVGLTITKKMVELMNGRIGFNSQFGRGSTFWIELPLSDELSHAKIAGKKQKFPDLIKNDQYLTILYIEDNPANLKLVENILAASGSFNLLSSTNAEQGIEIALDQEPDVILMDIDLPGMNGFDALKILKNNEKTTHIPVIAVSANAMKENVKNAENYDFKNYLTKPLDVNHLLETIKNAI